MSAQPEALEVRKQPVEELFYGLMARMPENMRLYDHLVSRRNDEYEAKRYHDQELEELVDLERPIPSIGVLPRGVAYEALGLYITERRIKILEKQINSLNRQGDWTRFLALQGRKVAVEPLADREIDHLVESNFFRGSLHKKGGAIADISLKPSDGGWVRFKGKYAAGLEWQAAPLFDRDNDYAPLFRVELL